MKPGDTAPNFELPAHNGKKISLSDFRGAKNVILFFYPKDFTRGCTIETKLFGENYDKIRELDAEVIGISSDSVERHREFANECGANYPLVADEESKVRRLYEVKPSLGMIPGRTTFVIDKQGVIRHIVSSQMNPKKHIVEAIEALKELSKQEEPRA